MKSLENHGSKEDYAKAKKATKHAVFTTKRINDNALFHIAKQIGKQNQDLVGEKHVKDDDNKLAYSGNSTNVCLR